jgi:hypothetical protein
MGEGKLVELRDQREKFEKYVAAKRLEMKSQADKVANLLEQVCRYICMRMHAGSDAGYMA